MTFQGKSQIRVLVVEEETNDQSKVATNMAYKHLDFECDTDIGEDIKHTFSQLIMFQDSVYVRNFDEANAASSTKWSRRLFKLNEKTKYF